MPTYKIAPNDILFFRDGRPMEGGASGHGANWPAPSIFFDALHAAFHRAFPEKAGDWDHEHRQGKSGKYNNEQRDQRFGSLQTFGPFPVRGNGCGEEWYVPCPQDVVSSRNDELRRLVPLKDETGRSDGPSSLFSLRPLQNQCEPSKSNPPAWWNKTAFEAYLRGDPIQNRKCDMVGNDDLYSAESYTGIGIDPATGTQDGEHIYSAEYLRLRPEVSLGLAATMPLKSAQGDGMDKLIEKDNSIVVGGQQRVCRVNRVDCKLESILPVGPEIKGDKVKWVLLSPAYFPAIKDHPGGWLPTWVDAETGQVLLKKGETERRSGEGRGTWRKRVETMDPFDCRLVAARIPKPVALSGWTEKLHLAKDGMTEDGKRDHGATPTILLVPAGAVYYFEGPDAPQLAAALNWHGREGKITRRSMLGEKGFGIGVCGGWSVG